MTIFNRVCIKLLYVVVFFCFSQNSMAALLDFTDNSLLSSLSTISNGYRGTIDGVGFTLTSTDGTVNFNQGYDGNLNTGCQSDAGALKCNTDGSGVDSDDYFDPDEISGPVQGAPTGQTLTLTFDSLVEISAFHFLDLYVSSGGSAEQATIKVNGTIFTVDATESAGQGGYAEFLLANNILAQTIEFTAAAGDGFLDDTPDNNYALAGVSVSAVPLPPAIWLFGTAVAGLVGFRRAA